MKKHKWVSPVAFVLLVIVTVFVVSQQSKNFTAAGFMDYVATVKPWGLAVATLCMLCHIALEAMSLLVICKALGYGRSWRRGVLYASADIYFSAITPSATGGQPASALFMISDGIPATVTTVVLMLNLVFYTISIFVPTVLGLVLYPEAFGLFNTPAHILMILGIFFQMAFVAILLLLIFNQKLFMRLLDFFLLIAQKLHLVKSAEKRREKLMEMEKDYRASAGVIHRHKRALAMSMLFNALQRICIVMVPAIIYVASGYPARNMGRIFAIQSWVIMGSNSVPLPGAVGVADYLFLDGYGAMIDDPVNMELLSRTISFYSCVLICAVVLLIAFVWKRRQGSDVE